MSTRLALGAAGVFAGLAALDSMRGSRDQIWAYHATREPSLGQISHRGLRPRAPRSMPGQPRGVYFAPTRDLAAVWNEVVLRFPWPDDWEEDDYSTTQWVDDQVVSSSMWTPHGIPPEQIEVERDGRWVPLVRRSGSQANRTRMSTRSALGAAGALAGLAAPCSRRGSSAKRKRSRWYGHDEPPWRPGPGDEEISASDVAQRIQDANPHKGLRDAQRAVRALVGDVEDFRWYKTTLSPHDARLTYRGSPDPDDIQRYAERMRGGEAPPPIVVISSTFTPQDHPHHYEGYPSLLIVDGAHRVEAAHAAEVSKMGAIVGVPRSNG